MNERRCSVAASRRLRDIFCILLYFLAFLVENFADGAEYTPRKRTKIKSGQKRLGERPQDEGFYRALSIIKNVYLIVLAPVVIMFLYSVLTDRATPHICRALWHRVKNKLLSHLAGQKVYAAPGLQGGSTAQKEERVD